MSTSRQGACRMPPRREQALWRSARSAGSISWPPSVMPQPRSGRPPVRSIVRFARPASAGSWVATTTSRERAISSSVPRTRAAVCELSFDVGSSARIAPFDSSARAIEIRKRCPPERFSPQFSTRASRPPGSNSSSRSPILAAASIMRTWSTSGLGAIAWPSEPSATYASFEIQEMFCS